MMREGERQVARSVEEIRRDHVARYEFAAKQFPSGTRVLDFACGVGYGCEVMARAGLRPHGVDISPEAITHAGVYFKTHGATFGLVNGNVPGDLGEYDAAVAFECIEHIEDPRPMLKALHKAAPRLICSVPNEDVFPWENTAFHFRHYTKHDFFELLRECGWAVLEWHGQVDQVAEVQPDVHGRTIVAVCVRDEMLNTVPTGGKHVAILGLGPSVEQFLDITKRQGGRAKFCDEVWAINALGNVFDCDLVFHMDDVRIQEIRAAARPASNIAAMLKWIKTSKVPVVTSRTHPDYPALVAFPLEDVLNHLGHDYFNNTAAYAVAFAIHVGVTELSLFGMDYTYANVHDAEKGRACVEFWCGQAHARGIKIHLPKGTTLMDANCSRASRLYGYDTLDVQFDVQASGEVKLGFTPRTQLPTADEIERNYDHSAPIAKQHLGVS